jgi:hypothetical protein
MSGHADRAAQIDYNKARRKVFWHKVLATLRGQSHELIPYDETKDRLRLSSQIYRGVRAISVDCIVGSLGRFRDFDRAFLPTQTHTRERWQRVDRAHYDNIVLPPIKVYQVDEVYFVRDGNHRVSVAREQGVEFIDAEVVEVFSRVPVTPDLTAEDLVMLGEQAEFMEATHLNALCPEAHIEFSVPGHYRTLLEHVVVHRYFMGLEQQREIPWEKTVTHWYDTVYLPVIQIIREQGVLKEFPHRTDTDLYLWIMDHLHYLRQQYGEVDMTEAVEEFAETHSQRPIKRLVRGVKQAVGEIVKDAPRPIVDPALDDIVPTAQHLDATQEHEKE